MLDWEVNLKSGKQPNERQKREIEIIKNVLRNPNEYDSWRTFIEQLAEDILVVGVGVAEKRKWDNPDNPLVMYPVDGASIEIYTDWDGNPKSKRYSQRDRYGNKVDFVQEDLLFIRSSPRTNTPFGLSPLEVAAQDIEYFLAAKSYAGRAASLASPNRALDLGEEVTQDQIRQYRIYWNDEVMGKSQMPIIGGTKGAQSIQLSVTDDNGLFLKWQSFLIIQIANAFGIDPTKFGALVGVTHANADVLDDATDESAIRPLGHTFEAVINNEIFPYMGFGDYSFRFLWTSSFQDRKSLAAIHQVYLQMNTLMLDEVRQEIGKPPLPDGKGAMTLAEHLALYGGANKLIGPEANEDAGLPPGGATPQDPTQNSNALNQTNRAGQTSKIQTRSNKPMNQSKDPMKVGL